MDYTLNLRKRILLGYLAPLALMVAASAAVYWSAQSAGRVSQSLAISQDIVSDIKEVHLRGSEAFRAAQEYLLFRNEISRNNYQIASAQFRDWLARVGKKVKDPAQQENLRKINKIGRAHV